MKVVGAEAVQPAAPAVGGVADSVILYSVTDTLSEAVNAVIGMLRLVDGDVAENESTVGLVASTVTLAGEP